MQAPAVSETAAAYGVQMTIRCQRDPVAPALAAAAGFVAVFLVVFGAGFFGNGVPARAAANSSAV